MKKLLIQLYAVSFMVWYRLTMWLTKCPKTKVRMHNSILGISGLLNRGQDYTPDPLGGFFDYLNHPTKLEYRLTSTEHDGFGDCDDYAIYWIASLLKSNLAKHTWFGIYRFTKDNEKNTHAVCVFQDHNDVFYVVDYYNPVKLNNINEWMHKNIQDSIPHWGVLYRVEIDQDDNCKFFGAKIKLTD